MSVYSFETVSGTIDESKLGHTQPHEHIYIAGTIDQLRCKEICINNLAASIEELKSYGKAGGNTVVDANPIATGRDALALLDASLVSGINIIATTGYHLPKFYPKNHWIWTESEDKLSNLFSDEIINGMYQDGTYFWPRYQTKCRAGLIKAMMMEDGLNNEMTKKHLIAAGRAAKLTGTSIMIHTEYGKDAIRAIDLLAGKLGVPEKKILICHVDRQADDYLIHEQIARSGVFMEYDTITLFEFHNISSEVLLLRHMIDKGFLGQLLISTDPTTDRLKSYGGSVGIDFILTQFIPILKGSGFTDKEVEMITRVNPATALSKY